MVLAKETSSQALKLLELLNLVELVLLRQLLLEQLLLVKQRIWTRVVVGRPVFLVLEVRVHQEELVSAS